MLSPVINTRGIDFEGLAGLSNVTKIQLTQAATSANEVLRKGEFDTEVTRLDAAIISATEVSHSYVDTTSADLPTALAAGTFNEGAWEFGNVSLHIGDVLFLDAAIQQDSDRAWLMIGNAGVAQDFKPFGSDVDAAVNAAKDAAISTLKGTANLYPDLGAVESKLNATDTVLAGKAKSLEYSVNWGVADGDGVYTATVSTNADFGTKNVHVAVLKDQGDGFFEHLPAGSIEVASSTSAVRLRTTSSTFAVSGIVVVVTGTPVI